MDNMPLSKLKKYFGYDKFRPYQEDIVNKLIEGKNVSVIMPTGGGKSLCFQIPSIIREGVGLVISPLIALMEDQVNALNRNGIKAAFINSTLTHEEKLEIKKGVEKSEYDLLYVSPEMALTSRFYNWLKKDVKLALVAIDESHCVSKWGHDFRPEYLKLTSFACDFPEVPRIALTATANEHTRNEILTNLKIEKDNEFITGFDRKNITYNIVEKEADEFKQLVRYLNKNHKGESGIVYCSSRKRTEEIADYLRCNGYNAVHYHAKIEQKEKTETLHRFLNEDDIIVVATIAFGMGIDKPNVRFVVHMNLASSIEAYYQETGRAGRDGKPSVAYMIYGLSDVLFYQKILNDSNSDEEHKKIESYNLSSMFTLCEVSECRRKVLINYFGGTKKENCGNCDNCLNPPASMDATIIAQKVLSTVYRTKQMFGANYLIDVLKGTKSDRIKKNEHDKLSVFGIGKEFSGEEWRNILKQLLVLGYLKLEPIYGSLWLTEKSFAILKSKEKLFLPKRLVNKGYIARGNTKESKIKSFSLYEEILYHKLKELRMSMSRKYRLKPYELFVDDTLIDIVIKKPKTKKEMLRIEGLSFRKVEDLSKDIISLINN